jgi:oligopeptide transport system permease protein
MVPGDPLQQPEGRRPPEEIVLAMQKQYKLDDPVGFYVEYLGKASGVSWLLGHAEKPFDLGPSLRHRDWTVNEILANGLPVSIALGLSAIPSRS